MSGVPWSKHKFIEKANVVHSGKYTYSACEYINAKTKVIIICNKHGEFLQNASQHLRGSGCPVCAKELYYHNKPTLLYYVKVKYKDLTFFKVGITSKSLQEMFKEDVLKLDLGEIK